MIYLGIKEIHLFMKTIVACSSGINGAIAIIRISGNNAKNLLDKCFVLSNFKQGIIQVGRQHYGEFNFGGIQDNGMAVYFKSPRSYTGEDIVEMYIHGGIGIVDGALRFLIKEGADAALPGEFSKRAFLNGKIDLSKAEGIVSMINAQTEREAKAAYGLLSGGIKAKIDMLQAELKTALAAANAAVDYPEEDLDDSTRIQLKSVENVLSSIIKIKNSYNCGKLIKNGVQVVITGDVNVGKSQLLNALVNKDVAIVADLPGTTRDLVKDCYEYNGLRFNIVDTAGLRKTEDKIEKIGINRAIDAIKSGDIILAVYPFGTDLDKTTEEVINKNRDKTIIVENKIDLINCCVNENNVADKKTNDCFSNHTQKVSFNEICAKGTIKVSALKNINIDKLKEAIYNKVGLGVFDNEKEIVLTELRHFDAVARAEFSLKTVVENIEKSDIDLILADLMSAYSALGEITGICGTDAIVDEIFSKFCVGK